MKKNDVLEITLPNRLEFLNIAQLFVIETAKMIGFKGKLLQHIEIAIEEAVSNVMKHTFDAEENPTFNLICEVLPNGISIIIREKGLPFDPNVVEKFQVSDSIEDTSTTGLGLYLLDKLLDHYSFHNLGIDGKETRMVKYLNPEDANQIIDSVENGRLEPEIIKEKIEYSIRSMEDSEAVEISKCAYKSHGYSFFDEHIYFPEKLVELNKDGSMISAVAVTKDNVFMGHSALLFQYPEDVIAELTFVFVNVEYRGQGALNRMVEYLFEVPKQRDLRGIYAYAVSNHIYTQKSLVKYNFKDCGILLATSPGSWKFKGISDDTSQRISVVLGFIYQIEPQPKNIFAPKKHFDMIKKLYENIGSNANRYLKPENDEIILNGESEIDWSVNDLESCGEIFIKKYGVDIVKIIKKRTRKKIGRASCRERV